MGKATLTLTLLYQKHHPYGRHLYLSVSVLGPQARFHCWCISQFFTHIPCLLHSDNNQDILHRSQGHAFPEARTLSPSCPRARLWLGVPRPCGLIRFTAYVIFSPNPTPPRTLASCDTREPRSTNTDSRTLWGGGVLTLTIGSRC